MIQRVGCVTECVCVCVFTLCIAYKRKWEMPPSWYSANLRLMMTLNQHRFHYTTAFFFFFLLLNDLTLPSLLTSTLQSTLSERQPHTDTLLPQQHTYATTCHRHGNPPTWWRGPSRTPGVTITTVQPPHILPRSGSYPTQSWTWLPSSPWTPPGEQSMKTAGWFFTPPGQLLIEIFNMVNPLGQSDSYTQVYLEGGGAQPIRWHRPISAFLQGSSRGCKHTKILQ